MFHSCTETIIKEKIIALFSTSSPLRVLIAPVAFGMGMDIRDVKTIIHFGSCEDIEIYVQVLDDMVSRQMQ